MMEAMENTKPDSPTGWRRVVTEKDAQEYASLQGAASVDVCQSLTAEMVLAQSQRDGFNYWLYDDGCGRKIGFMYRYVPGCGYCCKVLQYEQVGMDYEMATEIFAAKLRAELDREGVVEFETLGLIKTQPEKIAAIRRVFTETIEETEVGGRIRLKLDRSKQA